MSDESAGSSDSSDYFDQYADACLSAFTEIFEAARAKEELQFAAHCIPNLEAAEIPAGRALKKRISRVVFEDALRRKAR